MLKLFHSFYASGDLLTTLMGQSDVMKKMSVLFGSFLVAIGMWKVILVVVAYYDKMIVTNGLLIISLCLLTIAVGISLLYKNVGRKS